jgi:hypothetical protein
MCVQCNKQLGVSCEASQEAAEGTSVNVIDLSTGESQQRSLPTASNIATNHTESKPISSAVPGTVTEVERRDVDPQSIGKQPEEQSEVPKGNQSIIGRFREWAVHRRGSGSHLSHVRWHKRHHRRPGSQSNGEND